MKKYLWNIEAVNGDKSYSFSSTGLVGLINSALRLNAKQIFIHRGKRVPKDLPTVADVQKTYREIDNFVKSDTKTFRAANRKSEKGAVEMKFILRMAAAIILAIWIHGLEMRIQKLEQFQCNGKNNFVIRGELQHDSRNTNSVELWGETWWIQPKDSK